eukprot:1971445-Prorocentrum_lima.AAC.1
MSHKVPQCCARGAPCAAVSPSAAPHHAGAEFLADAEAVPPLHVPEPTAEEELDDIDFLHM